MFSIIKRKFAFKNERENFKEKMIQRKQVKSIFLSEALYFMESVDIEKKFNVIVEKHQNYMKVYFRSYKQWKELKNYNNKMKFYPPWICFPGILDVQMCFREGVGEEYLKFWIKWFLKYDMDERIEYLYTYDIGVNWLEGLSFHGLIETVKRYKTKINI